MYEIILVVYLGEAYRVDSVLHRLCGKSDLVDVELLVHELTHLGIVHFSASKNLQGLLLECLQSGTFGSSHVFLELVQLNVAFIDLSLDYLAS